MDSSAQEVTPPQADLKISQMVEQGTLLHSLWTYGSESGSLEEADLLMSPVSYGIDSGWITLRMREWGIGKISTSGELERDNEIRLAIFKTMAREGLVKLVLEPEPRNSYHLSLAGTITAI